MAGLKEDIELDVSAALKDVDKLEAALGQTVKTFKVELAKATEQLRGPDGRFVAKIKVDDDGSLKKAAKDVNAIEQETKQAEAASKKLSGSFDGVRTAVAGALTALGTRFVVDQIGQMIDAASDLAESQSKVNVVFGESAAIVEDWGETSAESVGLAKQQALEAAGTFGNLFTAMGLSQEAAAKLSPDVVQLGADFASFNNLDVPETLEKLRSGLVGEVEPLRSLGVSFTAANVEAKALELGLADANGEISEGAKVQARWALITEQSTAAAGDFARTSDGLANQQRILSAELGNARAEIGARLLPVMLDAVKAGRGFLDFFLSLPEPVQNVVIGVTALGIALGPLLIGVGNIGKAVHGVTASITTLSTLLQISTLSLGVWTAAIAGIGIAYVGWTRLLDSMREAQASFDEELADSVNNLALARSSGDEWASTLGDQSKAAKDAAVNLFLVDKTTQQLDEDMRATAIAGGVMQAKVEAATKTLDGLAESTGVSRERIVQLANGMRVNLGTATDEQKEKLAAATAEISGAIAPTDRLAKTQEVLGNEFATASEQVDAFSEALDAALGVYLNSEAATIKVRQSVDDLAAAFRDGRKDGETLQQFQDRLTLGTQDVTDAVLKEVEALVRDGTVSADAAAQKKAVIDRLLHLANVLGGPMAEELRKHALRVAAIPDEAITDVKADTTAAKNALGGLEAFAKAKGAAVAAAFAAGIVEGFRNEKGVITASADSIAATIDNAARRRLGIQSPSKAGTDIGLEFVNGVVLGMKQQQQLVENESLALASGLEDVWREAATVTSQEALRIFEAQDSVREAQAKVDWLRADSKATAEQLARAELELAVAQENLNDVVFEARDASEELADALAAQRAEQDRVNGSLDAALGAYSALNGVTGAQRSLRRAEQELHQLRSRQSVLPDEIAKAEAELARARKEGTEVTAREALAVERARQRMVEAETKLTEAKADSATTQEQVKLLTLEATVAAEDYRDEQAKSVASTGNVEAAERRLVELRKEQSEIIGKIQEATERVTEAQFSLVEAQRRLIEAGSELTGSQGEMIAFFEAIARQAGLSEEAIDSMVASIREATRAAEDAANAPLPRSSGRGGTGGGSPFPNGPPGTVVVRNGVRYIVDYDGQLTRADMYVPPAQAITGGATVGRPGGAKPAPTGGKSTTVNVFPKQAVYDANATLRTLKIAELLGQ